MKNRCVKNWKDTEDLGLGLKLGLRLRLRLRLRLKDIWNIQNDKKWVIRETIWWCITKTW
jgi:hypothetical protein